MGCRGNHRQLRIRRGSRGRASHNDRQTSTEARARSSLDRSAHNGAAHDRAAYDGATHDRTAHEHRGAREGQAPQEASRAEDRRRVDRAGAASGTYRKTALTVRLDTGESGVTSSWRR
jgi:hypothetical protein